MMSLSFDSKTPRSAALSSQSVRTGMLWPSAATGRIDGSSAMISFAAALALDGSPPSRCASCMQHAAQQLFQKIHLFKGRMRMPVQCIMV